MAQDVLSEQHDDALGSDHVFRQEEMDKFSNKIPHLGGEFFD